MLSCNNRIWPGAMRSAIVLAIVGVPLQKGNVMASETTNNMIIGENLAAGQQTKGDFYVAVNGKDTNPGTAAAPFASMARAREAVRAKVVAGLTGDILVQIGGGVYSLEETLTFGPEDSGTEQHSVTYAAAPGERVVLSGGRRIAGWKKGAGDIWTAEIPEVKAGRWYFRQLFVDGKRAVRARTPNVDSREP